MTRLSLRQETDYILDLAKNDHSAALARLGAILDRTKRLEGNDLETANSFNAKLVTELRRRNPRLFVTYNPPSTATGQPLPVA